MPNSSLTTATADGSLKPAKLTTRDAFASVESFAKIEASGRCRIRLDIIA